MSSTEAFEVLTAMAGGHSESLPAAWLARHVLDLYGSARWPVQEAALEACLRRLGFARRDELRVRQRPRGTPFGVYGTRAAGGARPYSTVLYGLEPLRASCDCPDFARAGLGLCKHVLVVLEDLHVRPRMLARAHSAPPDEAELPRLGFEPVRPMTGEGDWLRQVRWTNGSCPPKLARYFRAARDADGAIALRVPHAEAERRALVEQLSAQLKRDRRRRLPHPALEAFLDAEHKRLRGVVAGKVSLSKALRGLKRSLYPYQRQAVGRFLRRGRLLLADDMGLGKTPQAIACCHALWQLGKVRRGLLVVPASLKFQWQREWAVFTDLPLTVAEGSSQERARLYQQTQSGFILANYEQLFRDLAAVQAFDPGLVVLDEAQRIKNWQTKTARYVKRLHPDYRLVLSGTPFENRLDELASLFDWIDDMALEPKWRLEPVHSLRDADEGLVGVEHLSTLRARMAPTLLRRTRGEVLSQLPPRTDRVVPVDLTERQRAQHAELEQPVAQLLSVTRRRPLRQQEFLRLMSLMATRRVISNGMAQLHFESVWPTLAGRSAADTALLESLDSPKLIELRELVQRVVVEQGRKMVVFSQWRRMLRLAEWAVRDVLEGAGMRAAFFTGAESQRRRVQNVVEFHDAQDVSVLFATDAGGVGLNLQRAASCCVNLELPWNPAVLEQRVARIHRLGQTDPIDVLHLMGTTGIEQRIHTLMSNKQAVFSEVFDGTSDSLRFERAGGLIAQLQRLYPQDEDGAAAAAAVGDVDADAEAEADVGEDMGAELEQVVGEAHQDTEPPPGPSPDVAALFSQIKVEPLEGGRLRLEASGEAAATLGGLLRGMAELLERAAPPRLARGRCLPPRSARSRKGKRPVHHRLSRRAGRGAPFGADQRRDRTGSRALAGRAHQPGAGADAPGAPVAGGGGQGPPRAAARAGGRARAVPARARRDHRGDGARSGLSARGRAARARGHGGRDARRGAGRRRAGDRPAGAGGHAERGGAPPRLQRSLCRLDGRGGHAPRAELALAA